MIEIFLTWTNVAIGHRMPSNLKMAKMASIKITNDMINIYWIKGRIWKIHFIFSTGFGLGVFGKGRVNLVKVFCFGIEQALCLCVCDSAQTIRAASLKIWVSSSFG